MAPEPRPSDSTHTVPANAVYNYWKGKSLDELDPLFNFIDSLSTDMKTVPALTTEFDLETLRGKLDEKGLAIAECQESSVASRKQLAEKTKEFRRTVPPEVFKQLAPLLKFYQLEVDALTNRSKLGEAAFLDVFKLLYEAPDPAPAIASGLELASRAAELETQVAKTAAELAEYKAESKQLKNQDLTIRRLEEKVRGLEAELVERDAEIEEARQEAAAELEARSADDARQREERLEEELSRAEAALEAMRRMHQATQSQLFSVQEKGEEAAAAARAEAEYATAEVDRAEERLLELAKERDALLEKMKKDGDGDAAGGAEGEGIGAGHHRIGGEATAASAAHIAALREELKVQRDLAARLQAELSTASQKAALEISASSAKVASLQVTLQATEAHASALEAELAGRPTAKELEDARQQIRVLSAVVHNSVGEEDEEEDDRSGNAGGGSGGGGAGSGGVGKRIGAAITSVGSLESALLAKNRHMEHTLTMARLEVAEARSAAEAAAASLAEAEGEVERQNILIRKLEEDLVSAEMAAGLTPSGSTPGQEGDGGIESASHGNELSRSGSNTGGDQTMLAVLSAQRDRLRARVQELETQAATASQTLSKAKQDVEAARADNLSLVERLRFVQGYAGRPGGAGGADLEAGSGAVTKYMKEYEDKVNPFTDFRERERAARRKQMPIQDRAAYAVGSALVSGNKIARSAIVVYAFVLHLIAFVVLAGFSSRHVDKLEELEVMCSQLHGGSASSTDASIANVDPVVGGGMAAVVQETVNALL